MICLIILLVGLCGVTSVVFNSVSLLIVVSHLYSKPNSFSIYASIQCIIAPSSNNFAEFINPSSSNTTPHPASYSVTVASCQFVAAH